MADDDVVVAFKRRKPRAASAARKKRPRRAVSAEEGDDDARDGAAADAQGEAADPLDTLRVLEEVREDQRLRAQVLRQELAGRAARGSAGGAKRSSDGGSEPAAEYGLHDPKKDGSAGQKLLRLLDGQFTGQSSATQRDQHEELLERYIEEKLHSKRAGGDGESAEPPAASEEDALFALPDHLNPRKQLPAGDAEDEEESASGGVLIWNTGIAEVELPAAFAARTAKDTQRALRREAEARAGRGDRRRVDSSALPANFSTDFNRHRSDYVAELKALPKGEQRERGFRNVRKDQPGDNAAVARFRKFESRKMRR